MSQTFHGNGIKINLGVLANSREGETWLLRRELAGHTRGHQALGSSVPTFWGTRAETASRRMEPGLPVRVPPPLGHRMPSRCHQGSPVLLRHRSSLNLSKEHAATGGAQTSGTAGSTWGCSDQTGQQYCLTELCLPPPGATQAISGLWSGSAGGPRAACFREPAVGPGGGAHRGRTEGRPGFTRLVTASAGHRRCGGGDGPGRIPDRTGAWVLCSRWTRGRGHGKSRLGAERGAHVCWPLTLL